ncbi:flagellar filament capping protein FliD [Specibacter sp. RAF43]|uniref:flagellar filament capping protein FliD n=1 Tax=Specibacter sp. RAF43 TaxID=3233057 RepID=UPI003F97717D
MGMGIDGMVSGLDTTAIINALIAAEAGPQTLMKSKVTTDTALVTAFRSLNTKFAALATQAGGLAKIGGLDMYLATSSSDVVTATASSSARTTRLDLTVNQLAQSHSVVSAAMTAWPATPPVLTFVKPDGTKTEVTAASTSLDDMVAAINSSSAGVSAVKMASGVDGSGTTQYRLQLTATGTGAANVFTAYQGGAAEVGAGTAPELMAAPGAAVLRTGQDARVTLWAGTAAETAITSAGNTFTAIAPGVDVTVNKTSTDPVTVSVMRDAGKVGAAAKDLASSVNIILGSIYTQSTVSAGTSSAGAATMTAGLFTSESTTAAAKTRLFNAVADPIDGQSPATIGINTTKIGDLSFDADAFAAAYAKDPTAVEHVLATIAGRVAAAATAVSDPYTGTLTQRITGQQNVVDDLNAQILDWDGRLAARRASLQGIYTSLEVQLSKMQSQQSWLTAQLGSLDTGSSQKK